MDEKKALKELCDLYLDFMKCVPERYRVRTGFKRIQWLVIRTERALEGEEAKDAK